MGERIDNKHPYSERLVHVTFGCDGTNDENKRCAQLPTIVILYDAEFDDEIGRDSGTDIPVMACSEEHRQQVLNGLLADPHLGVDTEISNLRIVPIDQWLSEVAPSNN